MHLQVTSSNFYQTIQYVGQNVHVKHCKSASDAAFTNTL